MPSKHSASGVPEWASKSGSVWARRWHDTDRGLAGLAPHLLEAITLVAPKDSFRAFDIGCGPGSTCIDVATSCPHAEIIACDVSPDLAEIARKRMADLPAVRVVVGDAQELAKRERPFDLLFSRHGVMFFPDPVEAFRRFRAAANPDAAIVFSCFQDWTLNPWASELGAAAAGEDLRPPGREPSGFAFADPVYMREIFESSGWDAPEPRDIRFTYTAGADAEEALSFLLEIGPAARVVQELPADERGPAIQRMRDVIDRHFDGTSVTFPAAAWIWSATAGG